MRPHLTQKTRDMMYSLHAANPEKWDDTALAKKFGLVAYVTIHCLSPAPWQPVPLLGD